VGTGGGGKKRGNHYLLLSTLKRLLLIHERQGEKRKLRKRECGHLFLCACITTVKRKISETVAKTRGGGRGEEKGEESRCYLLEDPTKSILRRNSGRKKEKKGRRKAKAGGKGKGERGGGRREGIGSFVTERKSGKGRAIPARGKGEEKREKRERDSIHSRFHLVLTDVRKEKGENTKGRTARRVVTGGEKREEKA